MKRNNRLEVENKIKKVFSEETLNPSDVKKVKNLAMSKNIKLRNLRKRFCKKCLSDLSKSKVRINKLYKNSICEKCGFKNRWKLSSLEL